MSDEKKHYDESDNIAHYWDARHRLWMINPDWGVFEYKDAWFETRFAHLLPPIRPEGIFNGRALDYGCGVGLYARALLRRFERYTGFDTSYAAIKIAREYYSQFTDLFQRMYLSDYTGEAGNFLHGIGPTYDLVLSVTVLQHQPIALRLRMIEEIKRVLKPGGRYIGLEMQGQTQAYDMPPMPEEHWVEAWKPLTVTKDVPINYPEWAADNVWVAE